MIRSGFVCLRLIPLCLMCVAAGLLLAAQPAAQAPQGVLWDSYEKAAGLLGRAAEAHGGAAAIRGLTALSFRWEGDDYAPTQGRVPGWDTEENARTTIQHVRMDLARSRYVWDREFHFPGGYLNAIRAIGNGTEFLIYNPEPERGMGGTTYQRDSGGAAARGTLAQASASLPVLQVRAALARPTTLRHLGDVRTEGVREEAIGYTTAEGDAVSLYFDAGTHLLTRRELIGLGSLGDEVNTSAYSDYRTVAGFALPHVMEIRWNGHLAGRHRLVEFSVKAELPDTLFQVPEGYIATPAPPAPAVVPIADGVAFVENLGGGYRMLVVDTDEGLVVVDAPLSAQVSTAAIALIEKTFPGRPFRHVVITHHHSDHISGIPAFAAKGATILVAPGSEAYVRRMSTVPRTIGRIGLPPEPKPAITIEPVTGRRTFGRGARSIEIIDVSPSSHAASMLAVYVPSERLLFQGDLLRVNQHGGAVMSPDATRDLARIIERFGLDVETIGAVHGRNATMADLRGVLARVDRGR
ncbi:hypothetical protein BH24ACI5_BH24ACI5_19850 [soil metagenome]